jgi:GNAT superfamily N-acetyltransferase
MGAGSKSAPLGPTTAPNWPQPSPAPVANPFTVVFFAVKRSFTESEIDFFLNVDFVDHVALVAVVDESGRPAIAGGARYVAVQSGKAEVAFAVVDQYQGQGLGAALMHHLAAIARSAGLKELVAEVLADNIPMLKVFEKSGLPVSIKREPQVVHVSLQLS